MSKFIPYGHQHIDEDDIRAVSEVLGGDFITQGPKVKEFEISLANYCSAKYAVVFSSGTAALHAAYFVGGIAENKGIVTSPITFLSTTNAALFLGSHPVFVDIEPDTANLNPDLIEQAITKKIRAIVPVDYRGHPADLKKIAPIAQKHNLLVIEDACHALGAEYENEKVGSCRYSDMAIFSFHPLKSITTAEGGAVLTNKEAYYKKLIMFREHGATKEAAKFRNKAENAGGWYYEMQVLGYNYRLTDVQCALGISQLKKLDKFIKRRREIAEMYGQAFKDNGFFDLPIEKNYAKSCWHLYPIRLKDKYKGKKGQLFAKLREGGIGVQVHYIPVYWQPYYQDIGYKKGICPNAEDFYQREISIPIYQGLNNEDVKYVINVILKAFKEI